MSLSKENINGRKTVRTLIKQSEWSGHIPAFPITVAFKPKKSMEGCWATTELKGKGKTQYIEIAFDEVYMTTPHGRDLCMVIAIHELAHAITWSGNVKVEEAKSFKYGDHGPEFGIVYAQLWSDLIDGKSPEGLDDNED